MGLSGPVSFKHLDFLLLLKDQLSFREGGAAQDAVAPGGPEPGGSDRGLFPQPRTRSLPQAPLRCRASSPCPRPRPFFCVSGTCSAFENCPASVNVEMDSQTLPHFSMWELALQ